MDDIFTINRNRVFQLCESIIKNNLHKNVLFSIQTRGDCVDEEMLKIMKEAGSGCLMFGLETASERLMKLIDKKGTVKDNVEAVKLAKKCGFMIDATFIFGLPTEETKDRLDAYKLAKELNIDRSRFYNATPYPGTRLYEIAKQEGRLCIEKDWENFNSVGVIVAKDVRKYKLPYIPTTTTKEELVRDIVRANLFFYLRVKSLKNLLFKSTQGSAKWFVLPKEFYLKPKEVLNLIYMSLLLLKNLFLTFKGSKLS